MGRNKGNFLDLSEDRESHVVGNVIAALGGIALLAGIAISLFTPKYPEIQSLIQHCMTPAGAEINGKNCVAAVYKFEQAGHTAKGFSTGELAANFLSALGTALLISILVSRTIERNNQRRFATSLDRKTRELSEAVMRGMFNRRHPDRLIDIVSENILQRELIREGLSVHYVFKQWKGEEGKDISRLGARRFIEVKATLTATMTNVSGSDTLSGRDAEVPICIVLPNPMYDELKPSVAISSLQINGDYQEPEKLLEINNLIQDQLAKDPLTASGNFGTRKIRPGEKLRLRMVYSMVKEIEDSEFFQTLQISKDLSITLVDATGWNLKIRAMAVGFNELDEIASDEMTRQWSINDILLPHQGVNIWWKEQLPLKSLPAPVDAANSGATHQQVATEGA